MAQSRDQGMWIVTIYDIVSSPRERFGKAQVIHPVIPRNDRQGRMFRLSSPLDRKCFPSRHVTVNQHRHCCLRIEPGGCRTGVSLEVYIHSALACHIRKCTAFCGSEGTYG